MNHLPAVIAIYLLDMFSLFLPLQRETSQSVEPLFVLQPKVFSGEKSEISGSL